MKHPDTKLYSMVICPFAQRTRIHLELLDIPFELVNLDICTPRPAWFLELNPAGQVPVLVYGDEVVADSPLVADFLQKVSDKPLPAGSIRSLVPYVGNEFIAGLYILMAAKTPEERKERIENALDTYRWLDRFLADHAEGDPWVGETFGFAEMMIAPFFLRYEVVRYYQAFDVPETAEFERVVRWRDAMLAHPVVQSTAESVSDLIKLYEDYTLGFFNGAVPTGRERSSCDLSIPLDARPLPPRAASVR